ncbi:MAG TPA: alpha-L-rhamnosidase N-terminal domain-containing protein, partial [Nevskiaceae bacterium]|nr:alpha-L-rhamnosidase N-terminal domain-containing protein [Nevskiaceae bacterium]
MRARHGLLAATLILSSCAGMGTHTQGRHDAPYELRTEYAREPLGIDAAQPRLAWRLPSAVQTAYRVRVATDAGALESAPLWDSGRVVSADSTKLAYAGPALASRTRYWWQVQTWDANGQASAWSAPSWWETGLLAPADWSASWISGRTAPDHQWSDAKIAVDFTLSGKSLGVLWRARPVGKTYGEAYLWRIADEGGRIRLAEQVRRYAGGNSSKVDTVTLRTLSVADDAAQWKQQRHHLRIEAQGKTLKTTLDDLALDTLEDGAQAAGTVGFVASEASAATIHALSVEGEGAAAFHTEFAQGDNPFTGGSVGQDGLNVASGVPDKDIVLPIAAPAPLLRREFALDDQPVSARLYVAAGGLPRLLLNGAPVGEALADGYTDYSKRVLVRTYDVTALLHAGANAIGAELGRGWYGVTEPNEWYWHMAPWHGAPVLRAQLEVTLASGKRVIVGSDAQWRASDGPTLHDSVYGGERYDARL